MKMVLLMMAVANPNVAAPVDSCAAPAAAAKDGAHTRFDPLVIDLKGDKKLAPGTCAHAINTKGTGATGRAAGADHAINTKGTGAAGKAPAPGPGNDCDDTASDAVAGTIQPTKAEMAIKCKGTGAQ